MSEWIAWDGGLCPVDGHAVVKVRCRAGYEGRGRAINFSWPWRVSDEDIVAYRVVESEQKSGAFESQIGGDHYKKLAIQPMEYSMANKLDACQHTIIKYVTRFRDKGGIADLEKAKHTIDMLIELEAMA